MKRICAWVLALVCLAGTSLAAEMSEVRGYLKKAESEYQYLLFGTYPYEEDGTEAPLLWRILGRDGDEITLFTEYIIDVQQVQKVDNYQDAVVKHKFDRQAPFEESYLFAWVNGEMAETILKEEDCGPAIIEREGGRFHIMSYAELKITDYGFPNSRWGDTKENDYETVQPLAKNRKGYGTPYARTHVLYENWKNTKHPTWNKLTQYRSYGNSSPYWARMYPDAERPLVSGIVGANGHLSVHGKADVQVGVRPAMVLDLSKLEILSGDGTIDNPWRMGLAGETLTEDESEGMD